MKYKLSLDGDIECDKACAICGVIEIEPENRWRRYKAGKIICCESYDRNVDACNADKGEAMRGLQNDRFEPDYIVHPGEILGEILEARQISKTDLAKRCQLSGKTVSQIANGKASISPETAIKLERALGISASTWDNLEALYQTQKAKLGGREDRTV